MLQSKIELDDPIYTKVSPTKIRKVVAWYSQSKGVSIGLTTPPVATFYKDGGQITIPISKLVDEYDQFKKVEARERRRAKQAERGARNARRT